MELILAALSIGFLGSFHCIGMCGPIALALPVGNASPSKKIAGILVYHSGRLFTYGILGFLFGWLGKSFVLGGYQQALSILLGVLILLNLFVPARFTAAIGLTKVITPVISKIKSLLAKFLKERTIGALFTIGLLNGFLPCGLVYLAVAGAIATGSPIKSMWFMILFGAGTIPALFAVTFAGLRANMAQHIRKAIPVFAFTMAFILILRGMNLGIPYLSPELSKTDCTKHSCCSKK
ncbi:MAG: sulfite exporter TauE/SafE family protein [Chitinophagales bacterium]